MKTATRALISLAAAIALTILSPHLASAQRYLHSNRLAPDRAIDPRDFRAMGEAAAARMAKELEAAAAVSSAKGSPRAQKMVYVFGDSFSDNGNGYVRYASLLPWIFSPPYTVPRYSNGPMWPDYLGNSLGTSIAPVVQGGTNYAIGGATISPDNYLNFEPYASGFAMVERFLAARGTADPRAIYVVWLGGNDIDPPDTFTEWNFEQLVAMVGRLYSAGARRFLVPNLVDVGKLPVIIGLGDPDYARQLSDMTILFNQLVAGLPARFPAARIQIASVYRLRVLIDRYPKAFGFTNTTDPCYTAVALGGDGVVCAHPEKYWFWDPSHPTTRAHKLLSDLFLLELLKAGELNAHDLVGGR